MEEQICFLSETYQIDGLLDKNAGHKGVIVTHPHPLYGGDMYSYVVESLVRVYKKKGYTTLRFNFRSVENRWDYDNGIGEQSDVLAAMSYLSDSGITQIDLAGYSFGTWINAKVGCKAHIENMVMISPPAGFMNFEPLSPLPCLRLVITGSMDDIAPPEMLKNMMPIWNPQAVFELIEGADHFYVRHLGILENILIRHIND